MPPERGVRFRTKREQAVQRLGWLTTWVRNDLPSLWLAVEGGYAKLDFFSEFFVSLCPN